MRWIVAIGISFVSQIVWAQSGTNSSFFLQLVAPNEVQAIFQYEQSNVCDLAFTKSVVTRQGDSIEIVTGVIPPAPCFTLIVPPIRRQVVVSLGAIPDANYSVSWAFNYGIPPTVQWRTSFNPADLRPRNVDHMSWYGLLVLSILVLVCGSSHSSRNEARVGWGSPHLDTQTRNAHHSFFD